MVSFKNKHSNLPKATEIYYHAMSQALEGQLTESNPNSTNHLLTKLKQIMNHPRSLSTPGRGCLPKGGSEDQEGRFQTPHNARK